MEQSQEQLFTSRSVLAEAPGAMAPRPGGRRWRGLGWSLPQSGAVESWGEQRPERGQQRSPGWARRGVCPVPVGLHRALTWLLLLGCALSTTTPAREPGLLQLRLEQAQLWS